MIEGLGTTIDVVLVNGVLHEGDQIVVCGMQVRFYTDVVFVAYEKEGLVRWHLFCFVLLCFALLQMKN